MQVVDIPVDLARRTDDVDAAPAHERTVRFRCGCGRSVARRDVLLDADGPDATCSRCRHRALLDAALRRDGDGPLARSAH